MRIDSLRLQLVSGPAGVTDLSVLYALSQLPLSIITIIFFTNPLFVCLLAPIWLGERITWLLCSAVASGFIGAALVFEPHVERLRMGPLQRRLRSRYCPQSENSYCATRWRAGRNLQRCFARASLYDHRGLHVSAGMGRNGLSAVWPHWPCRHASLDWGFTA